MINEIMVKSGEEELMSFWALEMVTVFLETSPYIVCILASVSSTKRNVQLLACSEAEGDSSSVQIDFSLNSAAGDL